MPLDTNFYDVKYSMGDLMYELLPKLYHARDEQGVVKTIQFTNELGNDVAIKGGQLKRFLLLLGFEADKWIVDIQDAMQNLLDIDKCQPEYLPNIAALLGADLSKFSSEHAWRQQLKSQAEILKRKGTPEGILLLVRFLVGWNCGIELRTEIGYGVQTYGISGYGANEPLNVAFRLAVEAEHATDPQKAAKEAFLYLVLTKYLPVGATFEIVYA